ncbi:MAG: PepSY-associated TM helix domain-containing protein [Gemmatimonadota bacterium]
MHPAWRTTVAWSRTLHIYLTMFAFVLMVFFGVTGLLLNHEDLLPGESLVETTGSIAPNLLTEPDKLMVIEHLRSDYGAGGAVSSFDVNDNTLFVTLKGPGRTFEAEIDRTSGTATIRDTRRGMLVQLDDLHRGKDTGRAWRLVLDASSILLLLASVTGIVMWLALPKRRQGGLIALGVSIALLAAVVVWLVP